MVVNGLLEGLRTPWYCSVVDSCCYPCYNDGSFHRQSPFSTMEAVPAPFWFVQFFKVVGFILHMIPMGIWFAGLPVVVLCAIRNGTQSRFYARRMSQQLPVVMALGINFGIVPLLFLQTTYYKAFYTATILTAWFWIAVIPILIIGYYSLYIAAYSGERRDRMILSSILASLCLICIGMLNTNGLTLMVSGNQWDGMISETSYYGAVLGTAHNFYDSVLWMRLATMFGLGLITAGVWTAFDAHFLMRASADVPGKYRRWATTVALLMTFVGLAILTGTEYVVKEGTFPTLAVAYPFFGWILLLAYTVFVALLLAKTGRKRFIALAALLQFLTLAGFGVIRQIGQNAGMATYNGIEVSTLTEKVQWDPLIAFVVFFLLGVGVIVWMVVQCVKSTGK